MIVALDVGLKRIGIAISYENKVVLPLNAIIRKNRKQASNEIRELLKTHKANKLIVGIPKGGSSEYEMQRRIKHFVNLIEFSGEICYVDESFSSKEALNLNVVNQKKKDGKLDSLSAMIILQRYFDINH